MSELAKKLKTQLETVTDPATRVDLLNQLAWHTWRQDANQALRYSEQAFALAHEINYPKGIIQSLIRKGLSCLTFARYDEALSHFQTALRIMDDTGETGEKGFIHNRIGVVYYNLGDYNKALQEQLVCLEISQETQDKRLESRALNSIGIISNALERFEEALEYYQRSMTLAEEINDLQLQAFALNNMGTVYDSLKHYDKALENYRKSIEINEKLGNDTARAIGISNMGDAYRLMKDYPQALKYYQEALAIDRQRGTKSSEAHVLHSLGELYLEQKDTEQALHYLTAALELSQQIKNKHLVFEVHFSLSKLYRTVEDFEQALTHFEKYHQIKEEVLNEDSAQKVKNFQIRLELERKEKEAEIYRKKNEELARLNEELEKTNQQLLEAQIQTVTAQAKQMEAERLATLGRVASMIGHDMNNALSGVISPLEYIILAEPLDQGEIWDCWETDEDGSRLKAYLEEWEKTWNRIQDAAQMIQIGAKRAHMVINDLQSAVGGKSQKLGYINLPDVFRESVRLQKKHLLNINVIEKFESEEMRVVTTSGAMSQIFMNLLINACHALEGRENPTIIVELKTKNEGVEIRISDNGKGIPEDIMPHIFKPFFSTKGEDGSGLGLAAIKQILKGFNGTIEVESELGKGTTFIVWIPKEGKEVPLMKPRWV